MRPVDIGNLFEPGAVELRLVKGEPDEMTALQRVLEGAPAYAAMVTGLPVGQSDALSLITILPSGKQYEDKFVYGLHVGGVMVGCADVIRGFPTGTTAHIGLLLVAESHQRLGIGGSSFEAICREALTWKCDTVRIGVLQENEAARRFWLKSGFQPTGEVKPHRYGPIDTKIAIYAKALAT